jgi:phosphoglucosamine mutase
MDLERVVVGRDTRESGPALSTALIEGLNAEGVQVLDVGVLPTPGVAFLSASMMIPGFVLSASHNPFHDNGIKVIGSGGTKLSTATEVAIEKELEALLLDPSQHVYPGTKGATTQESGTHRLYTDSLVNVLGVDALASMSIVVDCANGAAFETAKVVLEALGAKVTTIGAEPNGRNINDGVGSTHPEKLSSTVVAQGADLGLALDGDADRLIAVDADGVVVDGDVLLALFAKDLKDQGRLANDTVVVTVMTNLGFHRAMEDEQIKVQTVSVGDRNVVEAIDNDKLTLGGEQSGHIIFRELATTGDGLLSGLLLADLLRRSSSTLGELAASAFTLYPQYLEAVPVAPGSDLAGATELWERVKSAELDLGDRGRILIRASGTEPVIRVMVEAEDDAHARQLTAELVALVAKSLGSQG